MAILIAHFCSNFGWYMLLIELPTFMNQILKFDMSSNAGLSSMPFLCMWFFTMILSKSLAIMQDKGLITVTGSRKIATLLCKLIYHPCVCFTVLLPFYKNTSDPNYCLNWEQQYGHILNRFYRNYIHTETVTTARTYPLRP